MPHVYVQSSGRFVVSNGQQYFGYAGRGKGRNNPALQWVRSTGPLPEGRYLIGLPFRHPRLGPWALRLTPLPGTEMFGRSGFLIHGDSATGDASSGCIILPRHAREEITRSGDRELCVMKGAQRQLDHLRTSDTSSAS